MKRFIAATWAIAALLATAEVFAQPPALNYTLPAAVGPGQATDITLFGGNLAEASAVWTDIPGAQAVLTPGIEGNGTKADNVSFRFTLPAETPLGVYGLRAVTSKGVSSARLLMVDDLPSVNDNGANKQVPAAQALVLPVAVDGACEPESFDYYKLTVAAGQRISVEVMARRLGSALDSVVRLLDGGGRELAYSDDEPGIGSDSRFAFQFAAAGDYFLEIRDIRYQGGANHRYRLRIGDFPLVSAAFPLAAPKGATVKLVVAGPDAQRAPAISVAAPAATPGDRFSVSAKFPNGQGSAPLMVMVSAAAEQVEIEPNDAPEAATAVALPYSVNGRFDLAKDRDFYEFQAKKGQRFVFSGRARSVGSPSDLFMRLYNAAGGVLAEADDAGPEEGAINYTFPEDGVYRLMVEDLLHRGGPEFVYRVEIAAYQPGFSLAIDADKLDAPRGGVFVAKVTSARRDYNGPITLSIAGAGDGFALANNVIPEGKNETTMSVTVPSSLEPGKPYTISIVGQAKIGETDFRSTASTQVALRKLFNGLAYPPESLDGSLALGVGPVFADFFQLAVEPAPALYPQVAGASSVTVKTTKSNGFDDQITLAVDGLPAGVTATVAPIPKGQAQVAIALAGPGSLAEGDYTFRIVGSATFQNQPKQVVLGNAVLRVVKPLEVTAAPAGPVNRGAAAKLKLSVARAPGIGGPVTIRLKNLPVGVTAPAEITIPDGQNEVQVDLTAAVDARLGEAAITAVAAAKVKEKTVTIESVPATLQVATP
ncbi:MAG TPA: PPC domain-containing protein [Pirellulales bacterium]|nr:PPC domain-containing protein [Pirellulales bacterium]